MDVASLGWFITNPRQPSLRTVLLYLYCSIGMPARQLKTMTGADAPPKGSLDGMGQDPYPLLKHEQGKAFHGKCFTDFP